MAFYLFHRAEPWPHGDSQAAVVSASTFAAAQAAMASTPHIFDGFDAGTQTATNHATAAAASAAKLVGTPHATYAAAVAAGYITAITV
jgi:hypothetical protein